MGNLKKKKNIYVIMTDEIGIHKLFFYKPQKSKKKKVPDETGTGFKAKRWLASPTSPIQLL